MEVPSYEEWKSATAYARFKYKWSWIIMTLFWIALVFIIYYMYTNGEALAEHPLIYGAEKLGVECHCYSDDVNFPQNFYVNGSELWVPKRYVTPGGEINWSEYDLDW